MANETSKDPHSPILDVKVRVLHAVEEHEQILITTDKRVELRVEVLEHSDSDPVVIICCGSDKELVK